MNVYNFPIFGDFEPRRFFFSKILKRKISKKNFTYFIVKIEQAGKPLGNVWYCGRGSRGIYVYVHEIEI